MPNPITTTGTTPDPLSANHQSGQSVRDWVKDHNDAVGAGTPGDEMTTTWTSESGPQSVTTTRSPGESDDLFEQRHISEYMLEVIGEPPIP